MKTTEEQLAGLLSEGVRHQHAGDLGSSEKCFREALVLAPSCVEAHTNLGLLWIKSGKIQEAIQSFQRASSLRPDSAVVHLRIGQVLSHYQIGDHGLSCLQRATQLDSVNSEAIVALCEVLVRHGQEREAVEAIEKYLALPGTKASDLLKVGMWCQKRRLLQQAIQALAGAWHKGDGQIGYAGPLLHLSLNCCDWTHMGDLKAQVLEAIRNNSAEVPPFSPMLLTDSPELQLACAKNWVRYRLEKEDNPANQSVRGDGDRKIRVGYLSSDFYDHATTRLAVEMLESHDHQRFEIFGYSYGLNTPSPMRERVVQSFDAFREVTSWDTDRIRQQIIQDKLDILVDLKGHTEGSRLDLIAPRVAPVQVEFLGYPGTMGAGFVDYVVADSHVLPLADQQHYPEKIVHLPGCYQPNDSRRILPTRPPSRGDLGLSDSGIVFCCFNNCYKITPEVFAAWTQILKRVEGSQLWLLEDNELARRNLITKAVERGLAENRLVFAPRSNYSQYLSRFRVADLFLDTSPVCAHTTASDSLWMGCPILTLKGRSFASRVSASLLSACGHSQLAVDNIEEYISTAVDLAHRPKKLHSIRRHLEDSRAANDLFRGDVHCRHLEQAFEAMYQRCQSGEPPAPIVIPRIETDEHL